METVRYFSCRKIRFIWDPDVCQFYKLNGLDHDVFTSYYHQEEGLTAIEQYLRYVLFEFRRSNILEVYYRSEKIK